MVISNILYWKKAARSQIGGECVEVARVGSLALIRDSKDPQGSVLAFREAAFTAFIEALRSNRST